MLMLIYVMVSGILSISTYVRQCRENTSQCERRTSIPTDRTTVLGRVIGYAVIWWGRKLHMRTKIIT